MDDWQIRVPTFTPDIANTLFNIAIAKLDHTLPKEQLAGIFHYSSADRFTRWGLVQEFSKIMRSPATIEHISFSTGPLPGAPRPYDCTLDCSKLKSLGLAAPCTPFAEAAQRVLESATRA